VKVVIFVLFFIESRLGPAPRTCSRSISKYRSKNTTDESLIVDYFTIDPSHYHSLTRSLTESLLLDFCTAVVLLHHIYIHKKEIRSSDSLYFFVERRSF
jgi:hypothetical protein